MKECVICKKSYVGYGNNAEPVKKGRCCNECDSKVVIPARIKAMLRIILKQRSAVKLIEK